jgi:hypothetical protein
MSSSNNNHDHNVNESHPQQGSLPSVNDSEAVGGNAEVEEIEVSDDEDQEGGVGSKRKLTSAVWKEFKRVRVGDKIKAKCNWCAKKLGGETKNGTKHLHDHLKTCPYRKSKMTGQSKMAGRGFFPIGSPYTRRGRGRGINLPASGDGDGERGLLILTGTGMGISPRRGAAPLTSLGVAPDCPVH